MTDDLAKRCDEIRERCDKATPGPWRSSRDRNQYIDGDRNKLVGASIIEELPRPWNPWFVKPAIEMEHISRFKDEDADFIAHSITDVPFLLSAVVSLTARVNAVLRELDVRHTHDLRTWYLAGCPACAAPLEQRVRAILDTQAQP